METISFRQTIPPSNGTPTILQERLKAPCTVEKLRVRFYKGQQLALQVNAYIEHKGQRYENLITYAEGTRKYLSGDDDRYEYDVVLTADNDDYIKVWVLNTDPTNPYDVIVDVMVDYFGGKERVV
jgi:hypothetical protein